MPKMADFSRLTVPERAAELRRLNIQTKMNYRWALASNCCLCGKPILRSQYYYKAHKANNFWVGHRAGVEHGQCPTISEGSRMQRKILTGFHSDLLEQIDYIAQVESRTRSDCIREGMRQYVEQFQKKHNIKLLPSSQLVPAPSHPIIPPPPPIGQTICPAETEVDDVVEDFSVPTWSASQHIAQPSAAEPYDGPIVD
jgi:hypothetical protein